MKCTKCHTENKKNSRFCVKCGAPLRESKKQYNLKMIAALIAVIAVILILFAVMAGINNNNDTSSNKVEIEGVEFNIPENGYFKEYNKYRFSFNNHNASIKTVQHFESSNSSKKINSVKLDKYYPGAETYQSYYPNSGDSWYGLKIKKDNKWFHIGIETTDDKEAVRFFDWMYEHNDWEGHK